MQTNAIAWQQNIKWQQVPAGLTSSSAPSVLGPTSTPPGPQASWPRSQLTFSVAEFLHTLREWAKRVTRSRVQTTMSSWAQLLIDDLLERLFKFICFPSCLSFEFLSCASFDLHFKMIISSLWDLTNQFGASAEEGMKKRKGATWDASPLGALRCTRLARGPS